MTDFLRNQNKDLENLYNVIFSTKNNNEFADRVMLNIT
jgi:hypothetical protein